MARGTEKAEGISYTSLLPPYNRAICTKLEKPGLISRASSFPPYRYPKVVASARRPSTRTILTHILDTLQGSPNRTGPVNVSAVSRVTSYSRMTVDRALAFGIAFHVLARVKNQHSFRGLEEKHPGKPQVYKSLWKLTTSKRAPSSKNSFKVQALASTKTGLCPSPKLKRAAMVKLRNGLCDLGQPRLTSAYGKYVWSKAATVAGIALLVRTASAMINDRTKNLPLRDAFAVVVQNINLACRSLDATERYLATLKREGLPDDIDDLFKKPTLANMGNYVETQQSLTPDHTHTPHRPHMELEGALPQLENVSPLFVSNQKESKPGESNEKVRVTNPECAERESGFSLLADGKLRTVDTVLDESQPDVTLPDDASKPGDDDDRPRPRAGPHGRHGGTVPRPFGPRRATIVDDEVSRRRRQARRRVRLTSRSDALGASAVQCTQRRDARTLIPDADH